MELNRLKVLLGISKMDTSNDEQLEFAIMYITDIILNYCNLDTLPSGLTNTSYCMANDFYRQSQLGDAATPLVISSISVGDTSTSFKNATDGIKDTILKDYKQQLNRYRKVEW